MIATAAGTLATLVFVSSAIPMLAKAIVTRDLRSYSHWSLCLSELGNGLQWIYLLSLPLGPIHFLHAFYTIVTAVMIGLRITASKDYGHALLSGVSGRDPAPGPLQPPQD